MAAPFLLAAEEVRQTQDMLSMSQKNETGEQSL